MTIHSFLAECIGCPRGWHCCASLEPGINVFANVQVGVVVVNESLIQFVQQKMLPVGYSRNHL